MIKHTRVGKGVSIVRLVTTFIKLCVPVLFSVQSGLKDVWSRYV
jgi:hypothetical protein